jgi:hypothetical protein
MPHALEQLRLSLEAGISGLSGQLQRHGRRLGVAGALSQVHHAIAARVDAGEQSPRAYGGAELRHIRVNEGLHVLAREFPAGRAGR